jgi:hypothetical protein
MLVVMIAVVLVVVPLAVQVVGEGVRLASRHCSGAKERSRAAPRRRWRCR